MSLTFHDHFSSVARQYADARPHYPPALFSFLSGLVPPTSTVWDCACGNGQATESLARHFARIIATDASAEQIAAAAPLPHVEFRVAPADASGLPDHSVDLVTVAQALHWFNYDLFYVEVRRVAKPGGLLAVWAYGINQVAGQESNAIVHDFYANVVGPFWPPEREKVEQGYRTIPFPFREVAAPHLNMEAFWTLEQTLAYFSTWSATNRYIKAKGSSPIPALRAKLLAVWGDPDSKRQITWPLVLRVGQI